MNGTSSKKMLKVLRIVPNDRIVSRAELSATLDMDEGNLYKVLEDMADLGLVEKRNLAPPTKQERRKVHSKARTVGWIRLVNFPTQ